MVLSEVYVAKKNEEIGTKAQVSVLPTLTCNVYFQKKDGRHMVLLHYAAVHKGGDISINEEYSDFTWVDIAELEKFEPKIENIPYLVERAKNIIAVSNDSDWINL